MSILKKLASQTATYGLSSILGRLLNYFLVPLYTRVFHAGEYGLVTQLYAYVAFLNILFTYGLETAFFRFFQSEKGNSKVYSSALISIIASSLILGIIIFIFASPLADWLQIQNAGNERLPLFIAWFAAILACEAITAIPFARLRQENKAKRFAFLRLLNIFINVSLNLFFLVVCPYLVEHGYQLSFYDPTMGVGYVFLSNLVASVITLLMLWKEIFGIKFEFDSVLWKKMIFYAFPLMIAGFAGMVNETFDRILLPMLIEDKSTSMIQLGIYGACYKLSILMTLFIQTFRYAAEPFFFEHAGKEDAKEIYARVMNYFIMACTLIFLGVMLYMDIVKYFIGEEYRSGLGVVPILLLANLFLGVYYNLSIWYKISGKTRWGAWFSVFGAVITLIFNFCLIPIMGYTGAAWATLICYGMMMSAAYLAGKRHYPVPYDLQRFFLYIGSAVATYFLSEFIRQQCSISDHFMLLINTVILMLFVGIAWNIERRKNLYLRSRSELKS